ncbi:MAG: ribonuclease P protein component [Bacteroidales bacterium]|nr:ribonuclease P protein component [Bacteroidales bacterium]
MDTLPKSERICGKTTVSTLVGKGRWGVVPGMKYCYLSGNVPEGADARNRMMVSVPKRFFKRAVKRNLLKRRIREAYRTSKHLLPQDGTSIMFLYNTKEVLDYQSIRERIENILKVIAGTTAGESRRNEDK